MSRHKSLADGMKALLSYRSRPEGEPQPLKTNWATDPDQSLPEDKAGLHIDRQREIVPSIAEIMREVGKNGVERNEAGQIIRMGKLQFSDGTQTEKAFTVGLDGKLVQYSARLPVGAMMNSRERLTRERGPSSRPHISDGALAEIMGVERRAKVSARRLEAGGRNYKQEEAKAMLAEAVANTPAMPPVTKCPPGLPAAADGASECFIGMKKGRKGESGMIAWEDISTMLAERELWLEAERALSETDKVALDATMTAKNMHAVGRAVGMGDYYAKYKGGGKRALLAANDNLMKAIRSAA